VETADLPNNLETLLLDNTLIVSKSRANKKSLKIQILNGIAKDGYWPNKGQHFSDSSCAKPDS
jgi:hypothetical protein